MNNSKSTLVVIAFAALVVCALVFTWTRRSSDVTPLSAPQPVAELTSVTNTPPSQSMDAPEPHERTNSPTKPEQSPATQPPVTSPPTVDPRLLRGNESTFKSASELERDAALNPRHVRLTSDQRKQLQDLLTEAEQATSAATREVHEAADAHAHKMIDQGLGWDVPVGQLARKRDPSHTSIFSTYSPEKGTRAFSFNVQTDPETAPNWAHKEAITADYSAKIIAFFGQL